MTVTGWYGVYQHVLSNFPTPPLLARRFDGPIRLPRKLLFQSGFVSFKSYQAEDGEVIAFSEWADEASARGWGKVAEHRIVQGRGRAEYYQEYTLFACDNPRIHRFSREDRA